MQSGHSKAIARPSGTIRFYIRVATAILSSTPEIAHRPNSTFSRYNNNTNSSLTYSEFNPNSTEYKAWKADASLNDFPYMPAEYSLSSGKRLSTLRSSSYILELTTSDCNLQSSKLFGAGGFRILWNTTTMTGFGIGACELALLQNGILQIRDQNSGAVFLNISNSSVS